MAVPYKGQWPFSTGQQAVACVVLQAVDLLSHLRTQERQFTLKMVWHIEKVAPWQFETEKNWSLGSSTWGYPPQQQQFLNRDVGKTTTACSSNHTLNSKEANLAGLMPPTVEERWRGFPRGLLWREIAHIVCGPPIWEKSIMFEMVFDSYLSFRDLYMCSFIILILP